MVDIFGLDPLVNGRVRSPRTQRKGGPMSARRSAVFGALVGVVLAVPSRGLAQAPTCPAIQPGCATILGAKARLLNAKPGVPGYEFKRKFDIAAKEKSGVDTLVGDPVANGAFIQVLVFGVTGLQTQCIELPAGSPPWSVKNYGSISSIRYKPPYGTGPVRGFAAKSYAGVYFSISLKLDARYAPIDVIPPSPGSYIGVVITFPGGGQYAINLGGTTGAIIAQNNAKALKMKLPKPPI